MLFQGSSGELHTSFSRFIIAAITHSITAAHLHSVIVNELISVKMSPVLLIDEEQADTTLFPSNNIIILILKNSISKKPSYL